MGRYTDTQLESYQKIKKTVSLYHRQVLAVIEVRGGAASSEIASVLHRPLHSISARLRELQDDGKIGDSGKRWWNEKSQRRQVVWITIGAGPPQDQQVMSPNAGRTSMT